MSTDTTKTLRDEALQQAARCNGMANRLYNEPIGSIAVSDVGASLQYAAQLLAALAAQAQQAQAQAEPVAVPREWRSALHKLAFMARTSGGKAGEDTALKAACSEAETLLARPYLPVIPQPAQAQAEPVAVPAGWKLVPVEPTMAMVAAGRWSGSADVPISEGWARREIWGRMLAAAPQPPVQPAEPVQKCRTCNGHGLIGGHMADGSGYGEGCPECNPEPAQPARQPLTRERVRQIMNESGYSTAPPQQRADFIYGVRIGERAHGITGGAA